MLGDGDRRRRWGEGRGGVDAAMLRAPDLLGSMRGRAANENLGSGRYGAHRRR